MNDTLCESRHTDSDPPQQKRRTWFLWALLVLFVGGGGYYYVNSPPPPTHKTERAIAGGERLRPPAVAVATATKGDMPLYVNGLGTVTASNTVILHTRVDGPIEKLLFQEGQMVQAGSLLAEIDPRPFQVQVDQAEGQLAHDQALLQNARVDLARYMGLYKEDSIAKQQLDTQAALVRQYQASIQADQAQVENARLQLSFCHITAPTSGRIGLRQVDVGNLVHSSDQNGLLVITQLQPITVIFPIPEDQLPALMKRLHAGVTLPVEAWSRDNSTHLADGTLLTVDNQIDVTTGTVKLKAQFSNQNEILFPNQFVNVRLLLDTLRGVTILPTAAIQRGSQGNFVYVLQANQTVTVRLVHTGPSEGTQTTVEEGIQPGEPVIVDGVDKLREGMRVEPTHAAGGSHPQTTNAHADTPASDPNQQAHKHRKHHDLP